MSTDLLVIVDDSSDAFTFALSGGDTIAPWDMVSWPHWWYGGTTRYANISTTQIGLFNFIFNGTSAAFIGNTPPRSSPQTATVQIDNGTAFVINYQDPTPQTYMQWFITPALPDGRHTITVSNLYLTAVDYAVVKVGNQTPLNGQTVIVDDDSSLIHYSGQWTRSTNAFTPTSVRQGYPYGNLTHRSSNPGDTFTFQFSGTSIVVYGIFSWDKLGSLSTTFTLDGVLYSSPVTVTTSTPNYQNTVGELSNHVHFHRHALRPGTHTLLANITEANNHSFILDYITYTPSFDTLSTMPSLSPNISTTASFGASSSSSPAGVSRHSVSAGTIVGSLLGGVTLGVLVTALVILVLRRHRAQRLRQEENYISSYQATPSATLGSNAINHDTHGSDGPRGDFQIQERPILPTGPAKYAVDLHGISNPTNNNEGPSLQLPPSTPALSVIALPNPPPYESDVRSSSSI